MKSMISIREMMKKVSMNQKDNLHPPRRCVNIHQREDDYNEIIRRRKKNR
jgi:hypothetical protein